MKRGTEPLVSIITPVYNGEKYLDECISSALSQTYSNWEYIIMNNCSTDGTLEIAKKYASSDGRIKVYSSAEVVDALRNHNIALGKICKGSKYVKMLHADDLLFPECIEKMVQVADANPGVDIVGSYILYGKDVKCVGIPFPCEVVNGREICKKTFLGEMKVFGPPSGTLIRSTSVSNSASAYRENFLSADLDICFRLLMNADFGFVHQILSYIRVHRDSRTSVLIQPYARGIPEMLEMLQMYGPHLFDRKEFERIFQNRLRAYYRFLAKSVLFTKKEGFWAYHKGYMRKMGMRFRTRKLMAALMGEVFIRMVNLQDSYEKMKSRLV